jgi:steroid delta-isomerase-like uncharacterized protein
MGAGSEIWARWEAVLAKQDYEACVALFAPDAVYVEPGGSHEGPGEVLAWLQNQDGGFSDVHFETVRLIEHGDTVVAEWRWRATHTRPFSMPDGSVIGPTGRTTDTPGVTIFTVRDGKIATARDYFDLLAGLVQLGVLPSS